ncbi:MAG TPA: hypothetical protein VGM05_03335 [Planctomycetaceae bacterium]|jgi:hypothetical protein
MEQDAGFRIDFPMYSYLMEPGPRPGALRDPETGLLFVPLWTDRERFDAFVECFEFGGPISGLQIDNRFELTDFLSRFQNPAITQVAIDPDALPELPFDLLDIADVVELVNKPKPK